MNENLAEIKLKLITKPNDLKINRKTGVMSCIKTFGHRHHILLLLLSKFNQINQYLFPSK